MKYIVVIIWLGIGQLSAMELSFTSLRLEEKTLALKAFKKLYKERRNVHKSFSQVLKHARAKSLQKSRLSFFQPKTLESLNYNEAHLFETNGVLVELQSSCGDTCILPSRPDHDGDNTVLPSETDSEGVYEDSSTLSQEEESSLRPTMVSPWALR